ncbi:MAG: S8 family serine peptidase [Deltaproteobacteria bacterium]|nr:S8 family serine peptidase [Deltaproteobacteria bacterium]
MSRNTTQLINSILFGTAFFATSAAHAANDPSEPTRVIVKFKPGVSDAAKASFRTQHGLRAARNPIRGVEVLRISANDTADEVVGRIMTSQGALVEFVEADREVRPTYLPNDPQAASEWHLDKIGALAAWDTAQGSGVITAICDSGVDANTGDLPLIPGWNVVSGTTDTSAVYWHGTSVAGAAGAIGNNGTKVAGVSMGGSIMPVRVTNALNGNAYFSDIAAGITWASEHGARTAVVAYADAACSLAIQDAAEGMFALGGLVIAASGNDGYERYCEHPRSVVLVSATNALDQRPLWSTYGRHVDLAAPGDGIVTLYGSGTQSLSGTSFAAPVVAGALGLIWSANPALDPTQARSLLLDATVDLGAPGFDADFGFGRLDVARAVESARTFTPDVTAPSAPANLTLTSELNVSTGRLELVARWEASTDDRRVDEYELYRDGVPVASTKSLSAADSSVAPNTSHAYTVRALDGTGNASAPSAEVVAISPPVAQILSSAVVAKSGTTARIHVETNVAATAYVLYGKRRIGLTSVSAKTSLGTSLDVNLSGLSTKTEYLYQVIIESDFGVAASAVSSFKTATR